jgi:type IV secretion system protein VirB10
LKKPEAPEAPKLPELPKDAMTLPDSPVANALLAPIIPKPVENPAQPTPANQQGNNNAVQENKEVAKETPKKELNPRYSPIIVVQNPTDAVNPNGAPAASTANGIGYGENIVKLNVDGFDSLQKTQITTKTTYIEDRVHTIAQGKLINAVLETAINTELPGLVRGIVSRDVYGEAGTEVLIPKGSRLFGSYSSKITRGQGRVEIGWNRLIRPDGVDMTISFNASDQFGRAGVNGEIDNKYGAVVANSMLTSVLAVGSVAAVQKLLTNNGTTVTTNNPQQGTVTTTGSATNQAIYDVSKTIVDTVGQVISNSLDLQPIIRVPQGTRITVIVNADINVPSMKRR